jgi:hypothetical protein
MEDNIKYEGNSSNLNSGNLEPHELQVSFPQKLFMLLEKESPEIISWIPNGKGFRINNIDEFQSSIIPKYFKHTKFTSFQRQLNLYGFRRVTRGEDQGAYFHPKFIYGRSDYVYEIRRLPGKTEVNDSALLNYSSTIYNLKTKDIQNVVHSNNSKISKLSQRLGFGNNGANDCLPPAKRKNFETNQARPLPSGSLIPMWEDTPVDFSVIDFGYSDNIDLSVEEIIKLSS